MLSKSFYPYKHIDNWGKFNEKMLPGKEDFYSHLNMEDINDADYTHAERVCKNFKIKIFVNIMIYMFMSN